jgi:hypothetical protein
MPVPVAIAHTSERHRSIERVLDLTREALSHSAGIQAFVRLDWGQFERREMHNLEYRRLSTVAAPAALVALTLAGVLGLTEMARRS